MRHRERRSGQSAVLIGLILLASACGKEKAPIPVPVPTESPGEVLWTRVEAYRKCVPPRSCGSEGNFRVEPSGRYFTERGEGKISGEELDEVSVLARDVALQPQVGEPECRIVFSIPELKEESFALERSSGERLIFKSFNSGDARLCYRGSREKADALASVLTILRTKYGSEND